jgi:hypothetical protein
MPKVPSHCLIKPEMHELWYIKKVENQIKNLILNHKSL